MKPMKPLAMILAAAWLVLAARPTVAAEPPVTLRSLLEELIDVDHVARWPRPEFTCKQASSYDRASTTPDDPKTWFANGDQNQFIRSEQVDGRTEKVMLDAEGPGAVVRFWITSGNEKKGAIRIYLDGAATPTVTVPSYDFTNNDALPAGKPLLTSHPGAEPNGRGGNTLFLPIPYARHCKITWEEGEKSGARYYQINYRTYAPGTMVETYSPAALEAAKQLREQVNETLADPPPALTAKGSERRRASMRSSRGKNCRFRCPPARQPSTAWRSTRAQPTHRLSARWCCAADSTTRKRSGVRSATSSAAASGSTNCTVGIATLTRTAR